LSGEAISTRSVGVRHGVVPLLCACYMGIVSMAPSHAPCMLVSCAV
jgi:hypothetical protein